MSVYRVGGSKSSQNIFPSVRPTLDLDFANSKTLDPRIDFTRASGGSYVGADGLIKYAGVNEARFDHDPVTGESLGLLVEEPRTNLKLWSERIELDFSRVSVSNIIENTIVSPYGTQTADGIVPSTTVFSKYIDKILTGFSASQNVCTSAFFKKGVGKEGWLQIYEQSGNALQAVRFDFDTKQLFFSVSNEYNSGGGVTVGYGVIEYPNGWYRLWIAGYPNTTTTGRRIRIRLTNQTGAADFAGDGISSYLYVWGVQCEIGSFPTSYIPTQGSTRTRAADNVSMVGENFSSWYNQEQGSFLWIGNVYSREISHVQPFRVNQGENLRGLGIQFDTRSINNSTNFTSRTQSSNIPSKFAPSGIIPSDNKIKIAGGYIESVGLSTIRAAFNGLPEDSYSGYTQTDITYDTMNELEIMGNRGISGTNYQFTGVCEQLVYYPRILSDDQLQNLTK